MSQIWPSVERQDPIAMELHGDLARMLDFAPAAGPTNDNGPQLDAGGLV